MTYSEAEEFIETVICPGEILDVLEIRKKYRYMTLREALEDYEFKMAIEAITRPPDHRPYNIGRDDYED